MFGRGGRSYEGQLGDGTSQTRAYPVRTVGLSGIIAVAAGESSSLALKSDGTVWAWGDYGYWWRRAIPEQVTPLSGVVAIAESSSSAMALTSSGTVWAWRWEGYNAPGPALVAGLTNVVAIAAGRDFHWRSRAMGLCGRGVR